MKKMVLGGLCIVLGVAAGAARAAIAFGDHPRSYASRLVGHKSINRRYALV